MNRKIVLTAIVLFVLLFAMTVNEVDANPFSFFWTPIDPYPETTPPTIAVFSPQNNTAYALRTISFRFNLTTPHSPVSVDEGVSRVLYALDVDDSSSGYPENAGVLYECEVYTRGSVGLPEFCYSENLTLPEGNHSLTVYVEGTTADFDNMTVFSTRSNATVYFTVDTTPPTVSGLSVADKTYNSGQVPLTFCVNEPTTQLSYAVDQQANTTLTGNTTLSDLSAGMHNLIIYAKDAAGNVGDSGFVFFNIDSLTVMSSLSIPEFTLQFESHPYDVPPTFEVNPYTGENVTIHEGNHVENRSIVVTIKNQPVAPNYRLYYNVRYKGHFGESWADLYSYSMHSSGTLQGASASEYTRIPIAAVYPFVTGSQVDIQVEAMLWHYIQVYIPSLSGSGNYEKRFTMSETSGWSNTQTITINDNSTTANHSPSPSPSLTASPSPSSIVPEMNPAVVTLTFTVLTIGCAIVFTRRNRAHRR
jgi:hypothetical protein